MKYLLDSNIVIAASLGVGDTLRARMAECDEGDLVTSAIVYAEVIYGSVQGKSPPLDTLRAFAEVVPILDFGFAAATAYAALPFKRASYDRLIAAHAFSCGLTVVTENEDDFSDIAGLTVENWTTA